MIEEPTLRALVVYYFWPMTPRFSDVRGAITDLLASCLDTLAVPHVVRCGAAAKWLLPATSTDDASAALEHGFGSPDLRRLLQPLGSDPSRFEVVFGFEDDDGTGRFRARPVSSDELIDDPDIFLSDLDASDVPAAAVLAAIQRDRERPMGAAEAIELSARLLAEVREAGEDVLRSLSAAAS